MPLTCLPGPGCVAEASFTSWGDLLLDWDVLMTVAQPAQSAATVLASPKLSSFGDQLT
jgi:hypothetical protein